MAEINIDPVFNQIVLVPTDFSDVCRNAIFHAVKLARRTGFKIYILYIITKETRTMLKQLHVREEYVDWKLNEYKKYYEKKYGVCITTMAVKGSILSTIHDVAEQIRADVMILGTHGKKGLQHVFGSYARRILLQFTIPVIVVQKIAYREIYRNIVLPVHDPAASSDAIHWAFLMARMFDAKFHIFSQPASNASMKDLLAVIIRNVRSVFDEEHMPDIVITPNKSPDFAREVISYSLARHADMIMIINYPDISAESFSLTTWNEKLMFNEAQIPVIFINPEFLSKRNFKSITIT